MGAAVIINRFPATGLAAGLREVVQKMSAAKLTASLLADGASGPAYVGRGRAKDLAVNVVLPFMTRGTSARHLKGVRLKYRRPRLASNNREFQNNSTGVLRCWLKTR